MRQRARLFTIAISAVILLLAGCSDNPIELRIHPTDLQLSSSDSRIIITYSLHQSDNITLSIHDRAVGLVRILVDNEMRVASTEYTAEWDGRNDAGDTVSIGNYYVLLSIAGSRQIVPIVVTN